jgi:hypothetical protein
MRFSYIPHWTLERKRKLQLKRCMFCGRPTEGPGQTCLVCLSRLGLIGEDSYVEWKDSFG